eukprot:TRINITY_DN21192_c0_g1_i1.p2 TRINITY_DN21192_c0_g1~~TRINITY_DN21192_c0_g1_i1.p2  ORF type:complete len:139 (+),score=18.35 TRINITY_DN21192_c0_g1_i1:66-482(+)
MILETVMSLLLVGTGFVFPCYATLLAIEEGEARLITHWLNYWVAQSILTLLLVSPLGTLILWLIPASTLLHIAINVWLWHPTFEGARSLVDMFEASEKQSPEVRKVTEAIKKYIGILLDVCQHLTETAGAMQQQTQQM